MTDATAILLWFVAACDTERPMSRTFVSGARSMPLLRRFKTFRLRTLLIAVAALGVALAAGHWLWRRHEFEQALEATLQGDADFFNKAENSRELGVLRARGDHTIDRLLQTVETDPDSRRCANALYVLEMLTHEPMFVERRRRCLAELIRIATAGGVSPEAELSITKTIKLLAFDPLGLDARQRAAIRGRAEEAPAAAQPGWVELLADIGGRAETQLLLKFANSGDVELFAVVCFSDLRFSMWPGLLLHLKVWLDDPARAETAVRLFTILAVTSRGRQLLVDVAIDDSRPNALRKTAIERLQYTAAGIEALLEARQEDEAVGQSLGNLLGGDVRQVLAARAAKQRQQRNDVWWTLIDGLPAETGSEQPADAAACLRWLQALSGNPNLKTKAEWEQCFATTQPGYIPRRQLLEIIVKEPQACDRFENDLRFFHCIELEGCMPLLRQMLESPDANVRAFACEVLMTYTDEEPVDVALKLIDDPDPIVRNSILLTLKHRFAVNFYWDTAAWEKWWQQRRAAEVARGRKRDVEKGRGD